MIDYLRLTGSLSEIADDEQIFRLVTLVSLFSDVTEGHESDVITVGSGGGSGAKRFVADLRNKYLTVLRRKLKQNPTKFSKINLGLYEVNHLANILAKLSVK